MPSPSISISAASLTLMLVLTTSCQTLLARALSSFIPSRGSSSTLSNKSRCSHSFERHPIRWNVPRRSIGRDPCTPFQHRHETIARTSSFRSSPNGISKGSSSEVLTTTEEETSTTWEESATIPPTPHNHSNSNKHSNSNNHNNNNQNKNAERTLGILVLLTVPLSWGTYTPVVKYMYDVMDPSMPGFVFSAGYYLVAALSLGVLSRGSTGGDGGVGDGEMDNDDENENDVVRRGGWELGSYLFLGNGLQVVGLQTVPADRAAFLVQLTTVLVPLLSAITAGNLSAIPLRTWIACLIAFVGVIVMGADGKKNSDGNHVNDSSGIAADFGNDSNAAAVDALADDGVDFARLFDHHHDFDAASLQLSHGDLFIVLAAFSYTMHVVRLGVYAPKTTALKLAASKATVEAYLSVLLVVGLAAAGAASGSSSPFPEFVGNMGSEVLDYFKVIGSAAMVASDETSAVLRNGNSLAVSVAAILWTGWVTCAYTIYAQSFGQRRVNPTDSNLIYTTQPLFSSMFAYVLLGETLGFYGYIGAILIGTALWMVSATENGSLEANEN
ncbi:hypothetical protein ACHAXS_007724 [Conticribra weissflogii]